MYFLQKLGEFLMREKLEDTRWVISIYNELCVILNIIVYDVDHRASAFANANLCVKHKVNCVVANISKILSKKKKQSIYLLASSVVQARICPNLLL